MSNVKRITVSTTGNTAILQRTLKQVRVMKGINLTSNKGNGASNMARLENPDYVFNPTLKVLIRVLKTLKVRELLIKLDETDEASITPDTKP